MFPSRYLCLALVLLCGHVVTAQTVVNSTFVNPVFGYDNYDDPNNWNPAEVPNNTATKLFNVNIATFFEVEVAIDATISNLHLGSSTGLAVKLGKTFTVTGATTIELPGGGIDIESYSPAPPSKFDAGTLSTFSNHTLRGGYILDGSILQFRGADVWNLRGGGLRLTGPLSAVVDEAGNDALRNLALVDASAQITLDNRNLVTNAPFLNEGSLSLWSSTLGPSTFTATAGLRNFDASTRTLSSGSFDLSGGTLRFDGADVVNLASTIYLASNLGLTDLAGNDGFRNLARILPTGVLSLGRDFTSVGSFTNDGRLAVNGSTFTVTGALNNFNASSQTLTGGTYSLTGGVLRFSGSDIVHNGASITLNEDPDPFGPHAVGRITDLEGNNALRNFSDNLASGSFALSPGQLFVAPGNFTNAGHVTMGAPAPAHDNRTAAEFRVPAGSSYNQTGGVTVNAARFTADSVNVAGGTFFNRGLTIEYGVPPAGGITGNLNISSGVFVPYGGISGNLSVGGNGRFHPTIGRFTDSILVQGSTSLGGTLEVELTGNRFPGNSEVITVLQSSGPITGTFSNAANGARIKTTDGGGSFVVLYESNAVKLTQFELSPSPAQL
jgi:hypothetical protein